MIQPAGSRSATDDRNPAENDDDAEGKPRGDERDNGGKKKKKAQASQDQDSDSSDLGRYLQKNKKPAKAPKIKDALFRIKWWRIILGEYSDCGRFVMF